MGSQANMKKIQVPDEKKSLRTGRERKAQTLAPPDANRLRKNLRQSLSSLVRIGLHYRPVPFGAIILRCKKCTLAESGDPDVKA